MVVSKDEGILRNRFIGKVTKEPMDLESYFIIKKEYFNKKEGVYEYND